MSANLENEFIRANTFGKSYPTVQSSYQTMTFHDQTFFANLGVRHQDYTMTYADLEQTINKYRRGNSSLIGQEFNYGITTRLIPPQGESLPLGNKNLNTKSEKTVQKRDKLDFEISRMKTDEDEDITKVLQIQRQIMDIKKEFDEIKNSNLTMMNDGSSFFQTYHSLSNQKQPYSDLKQAPLPNIEAHNLNYQFAQESITTPNFNIPNSLSSVTLAPTFQAKKAIIFEKPPHVYSNTPRDTLNVSEITPPPTRYAYIVDYFGSDQQGYEKNSSSPLTNLSASQNIYKTSALKKEETHNGEELKLSDLAPPDYLQPQQQYIIQYAQKMDTPLIKTDQQLQPQQYQLQFLSVINEEECDESQLDPQQIGSVSSRFKHRQNASSQISQHNKSSSLGDRKSSLGGIQKSSRNSPNTSIDNQYKMSAISQTQSIVDKIAELDKRVKQALSKNDKKS